MKAEEILAAIKQGKIAYLPTYGHCIKIDAACIKRFEEAGTWLLKDEGNGYRLRSGKKSVYVFPGQFKIV